MSAVTEQPRPLASLSSSLLARKGDARPAMRTLALGNGVDPATVDPNAAIDPPAPVVSLATARRIARESEAQTRTRKAAFTLRLDGDRHVRLRLASAVTRISSQQLVTQALDAFLINLPEVDALVAQLPETKGHS